MKIYPTNQKWLRSSLSIFAAAYEIYNISIVSDKEYDALSNMIDTQELTDRPALDQFFKEHFTPYSGIWIYDHPELDKVLSLTKSIIKSYS